MKTALVLALALTGCGLSTKTPPPKGETTVSSVITLTNASFPALKAQGKPVLMDFWAPWCGPCRQQGPIIEQVAADLGAAAMIAKVNVDDEKELARDFGIQAIPTLLLLKDGAVVQRFVGVQTADDLRHAVQSTIR